MNPAAPYARPRTTRLAVRFFWKECRRLVGMAIGLAVIAVLLMLFVKTFASSRHTLDGLLWMIAIGGGAMLAVAAAVTLFSVEKEEGTADWLARLPRNPPGLALGKVAAAVVVTVATTLALLMVSLPLATAAPTAQGYSILSQQGSLLLAEAFVWGLVASLVCANPLVAAVLGIAAASASSQVAIALTNPTAHAYTVEAFVEAAPARGMLVAGAALVAGWLASRWPAPLWRGRVRRQEAAKPQAAERAAGRIGGSLGVFGRLVWQTLRQSWLVALGAVLLGSFLTFVALLLCMGLLETWNTLWFLPWLASLFAPALLGAVVFRADQRRGAYRFLAEHAGRPRMVWLARNAVWLTLLVISVAAGSRIVADLNAHSFQGNYWYGDSSLSMSIRSQEYYEQSNGLRWLVILLAAAAYAFGQYFSLSVRSTVIAAMLALLAAVLVAAWGLVVWAWRLPTNYFVAPLAVFPFVASWLRASDWMFDRRGAWRWVAPIAALVAPIGWIAWATPGARLEQVEEVIAPVVQVEGKKAFVATEIGMYVAKANQESAEGRDVRDAYQRVASEVEESKQDRLSEEQLAELDRLSRIRCRLPIVLGPKGEFLSGQAHEKLMLVASQDTRDVGRLQRLLVARRLGVQSHNGRPLEWGQNTEYLAKELLEWATTKGRTSQEVLTAIEGLREIEGWRFDASDPKSLSLTDRVMLHPSERLMNHYLQVRSVLTGKEPLSLVRRGMGPAEWPALTAHEPLPFERERSFRALATMAQVRVAYLVGAEQAVINAYRDPVYASRLPDEAPVMFADDLSVISRLSGGIDESHCPRLGQLRHARTSYLASLAWGEPQLDGPLRDWQRGVAWRRAERVRLALVAYRIDKGDYPAELAALAPDYLAAGELHDLYSGQPLGWAREGFDLPVAASIHGEYSNDGLVRKGTPFLWSGGPEHTPPTPEQAAWGESGNLLLARSGQKIARTKAFRVYVVGASGFALPLPE